MHVNTLAVTLLALAGLQAERRSTVDAPGYLAVLDRVRSAVATAESVEDARGFAQDLPDRFWVTDDGHVIVTDMGWIDLAVAEAGTAQDGWPGVRARIQQRLSTMAAVVSGGDAVPPRPPRDVLQDVLARPEFQRKPASRWLENLQKRIGDWVLGLLNRLLPSGIAGHAAAVVFVWIVSIAALVALAFWLLTIILRRSDAVWLDLDAGMPPRAPAREWALRALAAARSGDLRDAVRYAYRASISRLEEQGVWSVDESRTPREYLLLLQRQDPRYPGLADVTRRFERVWYGSHAATSDDAQQLTAHLEQIGCLYGSDRAIGQS